LKIKDGAAIVFANSEAIKVKPYSFNGEINEMSWLCDYINEFKRKLEGHK
jgi:hypothetical protein